MLHACTQTIVQSDCIIRGDLANINIGRQCVIGKSTVITPPFRKLSHGWVQKLMIIAWHGSLLIKYYCFILIYLQWCILPSSNWRQCVHWWWQRSQCFCSGILCLHWKQLCHCECPGWRYSCTKLLISSIVEIVRPEGLLPYWGQHCSTSRNSCSTIRCVQGKSRYEFKGGDLRSLLDV